MDIWCWLKEWSSVWGPIFTAFIAILGVIVAYRALRGQIAHSNASLEALNKQLEFSATTLKINTTMELDKSFNSRELKSLRTKAAKAIRNKDYESYDVDDVLDFFEQVAMLLVRGIIDEKIVWHTFFWWFHRYYSLSQPFINTRREKEPTIWEDLPGLYRKMLKIEKSKDPKFNEELDDDDIKEFLDTEEKLIDQDDDHK